MSVCQYRAVVAYDGTDFLGFQVQAQGRTIQGTIEDVLGKIAKTPVRIIGAGRTDTGVHASGQVISFHLAWKHQLAKLQTALNVGLPPDIVITDLAQTEGQFHPRFDAISRQYRYTILQQPIRDVFRRNYALCIAKPIDVDAMQQASTYLIGTHDFASFGQPPQGDNTVRTVTRAEWTVHGAEITFDIVANAFLYRMVRSIVGTLLDVGLDKRKPAEIAEILQAKDRSKAGAPALPNGLCLTKVNYS